MDTSVNFPASVVAVTPTVTAGAYSANDIVGGLQTIGGAARTMGSVNASSTGTFNKGTTVLQSVTVTEIGTQAAALTIILFSASPSATTVTDNGTLSVNSADTGKVVGVVEIESTDYVTAGSMVAASKNVGLVLPVGTDTATLYAAVVTPGTPTYASTTALKFFYGFLQN